MDIKSYRFPGYGFAQHGGFDTERATLLPSIGAYGSYGSHSHTVIRLGAAARPRRLPGIGASLARHLPGIEASIRPRRLPGIGASSLPSLRRPRSEFRLRSSTEVGIPTSDFAFLPEKKTHRRTGPAPKVRQQQAASLTECFFHHCSLCRQSCACNRIAPLNPALATGLPHSILRWQQDCSTQSCAGNHSILRWQQDCPGVSHKTPALAARLPGFELQRNGKDQAFPHAYITIPGLGSCKCASLGERTCTSSWS